MPICIESVELIVAFKASEASKTIGTFINSIPVFAESVCVLSIVYSALAELSDTSKDIVGVLEVLLVTLIDRIIIVSSDAAVNKAVSLTVANATPLNL
jgi:hypothetical protein